MQVNLPIRVEKIKDERGRIVRYEAELGALVARGDTPAEAKQALAAAIETAAGRAYPAVPVGFPMHDGSMCVVWDAGGSGHAYTFLNRSDYEPGEFSIPKIWPSGGTFLIPTRQQAIARAADHWWAIEIQPFALAIRAIGRWCEALPAAKTMLDCYACRPRLCRCPDRVLCGSCGRTQGDLDAEIERGTLPGDLEECGCGPA